MKLLNAEDTLQELPMDLLVDGIRDASAQYHAGTIAAPARTILPMPQGGAMLSMPAAAEDICVHKLVSFAPGNRDRGMPTIQGQVTAIDPITGVPLFIADGPVITAQRTAAVSIWGIQRLLGRKPISILVIGTGKQASSHLAAFARVFPGVRLTVRGHSQASTRRFVQEHRQVAELSCSDQGTYDVVVTATSSKTPVYADRASARTLVVGVGSFKPDSAEIDKGIIDASQLFVDDLAGAQHEAGDLIQAGVDWSRVRPLAALPLSQVLDGPIVFKSVGCAAWDLAACRVIRDRLQGAGLRRQ